MLTAFEKAASALPSKQTHLEFFSNTEGIDKAGSFDVRLARSGHTIEVRPGGRFWMHCSSAGSMRRIHVLRACAAVARRA